MNFKIKLYSTNSRCLRIYLQFLFYIFSIKNIKYNVNFLPFKKKKIVFLKSPHVFKKFKETFELKKNIVVINFKDKKFFNKNLLLNKPSCIKSKIVLEKLFNF